MMSMVDREVVLTQRLEEKQRLLDKVNVSAFMKVHRKQTESPEVDNVSSAAKRTCIHVYALMMYIVCDTAILIVPKLSLGKHTTVGKTQEKAKGLAALAEKRRVKKERDANKVSQIPSMI